MNYTDLIGDNEDTTVHDQTTEAQSMSSSENILSEQENRITFPSSGELAEHNFYSIANCN